VLSIMPKRRRRDLRLNEHSDPFHCQHPTKRRKTARNLSVSSTDDSLCSNTFQYDDANFNFNSNPNPDSNSGADDDTSDDACFHFDAFRQSEGPYPCLYRRCHGLEYERWTDWKQHWIEQHRQYYIECDQIIPIPELNVSHPKIQCATFRHLELLTTMGSSDGMDPSSHCIVTLDLSNAHCHSMDTDHDDHHFNISTLRHQGRLLWDPLRFKQHPLRSSRTGSRRRHKSSRHNHCTPSIWDRIRSAFHCGRRVPYFWNHRILFRCGGYYSFSQNQAGHYNEMESNSLSAYCDAFDIDRKLHYPLPDLPQPLHSSSTIYLEALHCLLNVGGDDYNGNAVDEISTLVLDGHHELPSDHQLRWNQQYFPKMKVKRSYRPSLGLYDDGQTMLLFAAGGCHYRYDGIKSVESLRLNPWIDDRRRNDNDGIHKNWKSKWKKERNLCVPRRDASSLLHWKGMNAMVCCGGDHGEGTPEPNAILPWRTSERFDLAKSKWIRFPDFPEQSSHAQNPFIWIEGGVKDENYWSGIRETSLFEGFESSFDASTGVLCIVGNGFCTEELGIISFYDPRSNKWQSRGRSRGNHCDRTSSTPALEFETNYLGALDEAQEIRNICGVVRP